MASNNGSAAASLLDVAIRAAVQAGAPRRTVAATAAAVASVVMVELRGSAGARGDASATPSASQKRRLKRKKKAEKEKVALSPSDPHSKEHDASQGECVGDASAPEFTSMPATLTLSSVDEQTPALSPLSEVMSPTMCQHCGQDFPSRKKLFLHLKETGHGKFFAPSCVGDVEAGSSLSAGSFYSQANTSQLSAALADQANGINESSPGGGSASPARSSIPARVVSEAPSYGPLPANQKGPKGRGRQ